MTQQIEMPLLRVQGVSKTFSGTRVLDDVSFDVHAGEVVGVVGRNGSGKSTLVKVIVGVHRPDSGSRILLGRGIASDPSAPNRATAGGPVGLHALHQELGLVAQLSTVENLSLDEGGGRADYLPFSRRRERRRAERLIAYFGVDFDVTIPVGRLSAAERTIVALVRALGRWTGPRNVLVLDEPTATLAPEEVAKLFVAIRRAVADGAGVIFVSHRLHEVMELADRTVVLRDGRVVATVRNADSSVEHLVDLVVGGVGRAGVTRAERPTREAVLEVEALSGPRVRRIDFDLHAGEVVGIAGLLGSGREEVSSLIFGAVPSTGGHVTIAGTKIDRPEPRRAVRAGVGFVSAHRARDGVFMTLSARENFTLPHLRPLTGRLGHLGRAAERREVDKWFRTIELRPPDPELKLMYFSGGNQQKIAIGRWLRAGARLLLLDEPTQGVDVSGRASIYELLTLAADTGTAIVVSSSDAAELAQLCDRVLVMHDGAVRATLEGGDLTETRIERFTLDPERAAG